jgi:hypothetical protein
MERLGTQGAAEMRWATGKACATAQQPQQCADELERLAQTVQAGRLQRGQILSQHWLATTRGDEVRPWTSREDWLGFLGTIDTPAEALLLAWYDLYSVECVEPSAAGYRVKASKLTRDCPMEITGYQLQVTASGKVSVQNSEVTERSSACVGRRPAGLATAAPFGNMAPLAAFFARVAHLEAAAVLAFQHVARELCAYRAPARLIADTQRAIRDELCHARLMGRLALKLGGEPEPPALEALPVRPLPQAALDNAVEGSLRETFGALVGTYQSMRAASPGVRRLLNDVAADERRHAALSWRLERWFSKRLSLATQREIQGAKHAALKQLRDEWSSDPPKALMKHAGLPGAAHAQRMLDGLEAMLHSFAAAPGAA